MPSQFECPEASVGKGAGIQPAGGVAGQLVKRRYGFGLWPVA